MLRPGSWHNGSLSSASTARSSQKPKRKQFLSRDQGEMSRYALASFGIGTTEYVIMGLLPSVAQDLSVSIPQAGLLVTGYALSVAFGSPWLTVATARMDR